MFDSIVNVNDFFSSHWLAESFPAKLKDLNKVWKERAEHGKHSPLRQLAISAGGFLARRADLPAPGDESFVEELTALHAVLLAAMGYQAEPTTLETEQAGTPIEIPLLARIQGPGAESLHVLQARPVDSLDDLFAEDARFVEPILVRHSETKTEEVRGIADAVQLLFLTEQSPRYLLIMAGSWVVVSDVERWAEGRYLAFDMDTAMSRRDDKPTGELAWHSGLWSSDVLLPADEGSTAIEEFSRDSVKHAVGVSADLREGLRTSVELIANAVIVARRQRGEMVEGDSDLPGELTRQSLRFLYRILFLLFAESRPELGVLPVGAIDYGTGYGLDRFRDLVQQPLTTEQALHGTHLHDSLRLLFRLVNDGYNQGIKDGDGLVFEPLRADLFEPAKARLVDEIDLPNEVLQQVLGLLLLSKPTKGRARGYVSYAQLGINQLGAVYEGLMSYSGFIADRRLVELAKDGEADKGTWLVPAENVGDYDEKHVVLREDRRTGAKTKVTHEKGTFVYRLSGRDRQRSASYYTPEVLTRTVVKHALAELIRDDTTAAEILEYRICELALGSGAFLNEAINQLAGAYLERRRLELNRDIPAGEFQRELQKVKTFLALHRAYGVDLNQTAVELAEVSLWLNVMHVGLQAPWFGLHLRRGNSLVGGRRATYDLAALARAKRSYWTAAPSDRPLHTDGGAGGIGADEVHHFLLPAAGWGAVSETKYAKEFAPRAAAALHDWRSSILRNPDRRQADRLRGLGKRVERMWQLTRRRLEISEREVSRSIDVWGREDSPSVKSVTREVVESALRQPDSPYQRLRLTMDLWCALFYWPVSGPSLSLPSLDGWIGCLEELLGVQGKSTKGTTVDDLASLSDEFEALGELDDNERVLYGMRPAAEVVARHAWVGKCRAIANREGFFHWELDFSQVFAKGGFDLQVGNPPWVRPIWEENPILAEFDASFGLEESVSEVVQKSRRDRILSSERNVEEYLDSLAAHHGLASQLNSAVEHQVLAGVQTNLYMVFMERVWRSTRKGGVACLLHPEGHFTDPKARWIRAAAYSRLRRYMNFRRADKWFEGVDSPSMTFGLHCYSDPGPVLFSMAARVMPEEVLEYWALAKIGNDLSVLEDFPGTLGDDNRIILIGGDDIETWGRLFEGPSVGMHQAKLIWPNDRNHAAVLLALGSVSERMRTHAYESFAGLHERNAQRDGLLELITATPSSWSEAVLQGPHLAVSNPFAKNPNEHCSSKNDWTPWSLPELPRTAIPRTNFRLKLGRSISPPVFNRYRILWRRRIDVTNARSFQAALYPPGPTHIDTMSSLAMPTDEQTAVVLGMWSSISIDYFVKVTGKPDVRTDVVDRFPAPLGHPAVPSLLLRTLRLNCLTEDYSEFWSSVYTQELWTDSWTSSFSALPGIASVNAVWSPDSPLRSDFERRGALVEIDALVAIMFGLSAEELSLMYTGQFGVLRKYEDTTWYDNAGQRIGKETHAKGVYQRSEDYKLLMAYNDGAYCGDLLERYQPPFINVDRDAQMRAAHAEFTERLGL